MWKSSKSWWTAAALVMGWLLLGAPIACAGDKKDKKGEPKPAPLLNKTDELTADDEKDTHPVFKNPRKVYKIKLAEGKTYQIDHKSKDFDALLRLEDPAGKEVAFNDDAIGVDTLDSRIIYRAPAAGEYRIIATCLDGNLGKFTVTVVETTAAVSIFKDKGSDLKLADGKGTFAGELNANDPVTQDHYYKLFLVRFEAGKTYRITHSSDDFDAFLFLEDPAGNKLAQDDDSGGGLNSRIVHKAAKAGTYRIIATTLPARKTGKFTLEIVPASPDDEKQSRSISPSLDRALTDKASFVPIPRRTIPATSFFPSL